MGGWGVAAAHLQRKRRALHVLAALGAAHVQLVRARAVEPVLAQVLAGAHVLERPLERDVLRRLRGASVAVRPIRHRHEDVAADALELAQRVVRLHREARLGAGARHAQPLAARGAQAQRRAARPHADAEGRAADGLAVEEHEQLVLAAQVGRVRALVRAVAHVALLDARRRHAAEDQVEAVAARPSLVARLVPRQDREARLLAQRGLAQPVAHGDALARAAAARERPAQPRAGRPRRGVASRRGRSAVRGDAPRAGADVLHADASRAPRRSQWWRRGVASIALRRSVASRRRRRRPRRCGSGRRRRWRLKGEEGRRRWRGAARRRRRAVLPARHQLFPLRAPALLLRLGRRGGRRGGRILVGQLGELAHVSVELLEVLAVEEAAERGRLRRAGRRGGRVWHSAAASREPTDARKVLG